MTNMKRMLVLSIFLLSIGSVLICDTIEQISDQKTQRLEASLTYEALSPRDIYPPWKSLFLNYFIKAKDNATLFFSLGGFSREEGESLLGIAGAYKDWGKRFYTYTALAAGSDSVYLPKIRFDNDFNLKLGTKKNIVLTAGFTYLKYHNVHKDLILSSGVTVYLGRWIATYRIFMNRSDPGNITSYSHLFDTAYGMEGGQWTNVTLSFGKQAYLATYLASPEEVNRRSLYIVLKHRRWIGKTFGLLGDISYFKLEDGYKKIGITLGIFKEF